MQRREEQQREQAQRRQRGTSNTFEALLTGLLSQGGFNQQTRRSAAAVQEHVRDASQRMVPGILTAANAIMRGDLIAADTSLTNAIQSVVEPRRRTGIPTATAVPASTAADANTVEAEIVSDDEDAGGDFINQLNALSMTFARDLLANTTRTTQTQQDTTRTSNRAPRPGNTRTRGDSVD